jgi:hypothetical protein
MLGTGLPSMLASEVRGGNEVYIIEYQTDFDFTSAGANPVLPSLIISYFNVFHEPMTTYYNCSLFNNQATGIFLLYFSQRAINFGKDEEENRFVLVGRPDGTPYSVTEVSK